MQTIFSENKLFTWVNYISTSTRSTNSTTSTQVLQILQAQPPTKTSKLVFNCCPKTPARWKNQTHARKHHWDYARPSRGTPCQATRQGEIRSLPSANFFCEVEPPNGSTPTAQSNGSRPAARGDFSSTKHHLERTRMPAPARPRVATHFRPEQDNRSDCITNFFISPCFAGRRLWIPPKQHIDRRTEKDKESIGPRRLPKPERAYTWPTTTRPAAAIEPKRTDANHLPSEQTQGHHRRANATTNQPHASEQRKRRPPTNPTKTKGEQTPTTNMPANKRWPRTKASKRHHQLTNHNKTKGEHTSTTTTPVNKRWPYTIPCTKGEQTPFTTTTAAAAAATTATTTTHPTQMRTN